MTKPLTEEQIIECLHMEPHPEGGFFAECHYEHKSEGRPASGSIYYYLGAGDHSDFHRIDCGEYWSHITGSALELWIVSPEGNLQVKQLGLGGGQEPLLYVPAGSIFAAKHSPEENEGTLVSCITVPRFTYEGFAFVGKEELEQLCPQALDFYS